MKGKQNGITLIALVITIVVMLILAGVTLSTVVGNNGVLTKSRQAVEKNREAEAMEEVNMAWSSCEMAYQTAWAGNTAVQRSAYYTMPIMNEALSSTGEVISLVYNENGESEVTYQSKNQGLTYMFKISATGEVRKNQGIAVDKKIVNLVKDDAEGMTIVATVVGLEGKKGTDITWTVTEGTGIITKTDVGTSGNTATVKVVATGTEGTAKLKATCEGYNQEIIITSKAAAPYIDGTKYYIYEGAQAEIITKDNFGKYLGKKVNYVPANISTNTSYGTSATYRIFYIAFDNKYGDGAGTIYLKADEDGKNVTLSSYAHYSTTDSYAVMKKLNPSWIQPASLQTNDKCVSWILDSNVWTAWKDTSTTSVKDNINYVVGAPSLEMYVDSYNAYLDAHPGLVKNEGTNPAEKLACEYVTSGYAAQGYRIGFLNTNKDSWANTGYYQGNNSLIAPTTLADKMYNPGSGRYYWLASPSANFGSNVIFVNGLSSIVSSNRSSNDNALCPLVSLKSGVKLTIGN